MEKSDFEKKLGSLIENYLKTAKSPEQARDIILDSLGGHLICLVASVMYDEGYSLKEAKSEAKHICDDLKDQMSEEFSLLKNEVV